MSNMASDQIIMNRTTTERPLSDSMVSISIEIL